jgi:hypothetical protein
VPHDRSLIANESEERCIVVMDPQAEPNAWLTRTGWADHLNPCSLAQLHQLSFPIRDDEIQLCWISDCICQVIDEAVTYRSMPISKEIRG